MPAAGSGKLRDATVRRSRVAAVLSGAARRGDAASARIGESAVRLRYRFGEAKIGLGDLDRVTVGGGAQVDALYRTGPCNAGPRTADPNQAQADFQ